MNWHKFKAARNQEADADHDWKKVKDLDVNSTKNDNRDAAASILNTVLVHVICPVKKVQAIDWRQGIVLYFENKSSRHVLIFCLLRYYIISKELDSS